MKSTEERKNNWSEENLIKQAECMRAVGKSNKGKCKSEQHKKNIGESVHYAAVKRKKRKELLKKGTYSITDNGIRYKLPYEIFDAIMRDEIDWNTYDKSNLKQIKVL